MSSVEILSNSQIEKLNKTDLQKYAANLTHAYRKLYDKLFNETDGVIPRLESQLAISNNTNKLLMQKLIEVEKTSNGNAQYARKETIELHGFDPETLDEVIEDSVLSIINSSRIKMINLSL